MSKSVLISTQPKWCGEIKSERKTIEVRKTRPTIETPFKSYIYCTKGATINDNLWITDLSGYNHLGNGKVIGEFVCDAIYPIRVFENGSIQNWNYFGLHESCLSLDEMANYIGRNKTGYGWHISDLKIYAEPKSLSEFRTICKYSDDYPCHFCNKSKYESRNILYCDNILKRPPQSWCYVEGCDDID